MTASVTLLFYSALDGFLQHRWTERIFLENSAEIASLYISGIVAPHVRAPIGNLEPGSAEYIQLAEAIENADLRRKTERIKIWRTDGTIIYSTVPSLVGRQFSFPALDRASKGQITIATSDPGRDQDRLGARKHRPMLEVYIPIRDETGAVVAVGELHQDREEATEGVDELLIGMWLIRLLTLGLGGCTLFYLVRRAHNTIVAQRRHLRRHLRGLRRLSRQNSDLRSVADEARRKAVLANEELLSRVGAEIHDGPIQLLSVAMLGLGNGNAIRKEGGASGPPPVTTLMSDAISQLRTISAGLILPEIEKLTPTEAIRLGIERHEQMTGTTVESSIAELPRSISQGLKACMYRIVQECLNNAVRHADGRGQKVVVNCDDRSVTLIISDEGEQATVFRGDDGRIRLGLQGLRNRVDAFGGSLRTDASSRGMSVTATIPLDADREARIETRTEKMS